LGDDKFFSFEVGLNFHIKACLFLRFKNAFKKFEFFFFNSNYYFFMFLYYFDVMIYKSILKNKKKYYLNIFFLKNIFKNNRYIITSILARALQWVNNKKIFKCKNA
jgi:hypothetical protein